MFFFYRKKVKHVFLAIFGIMMYNHFASKTQKGEKAMLVVVCDMLLGTFVC